MNQNSFLRYFSILFVVAIGVIYALPNLYPSDPSVQVLASSSKVTVNEKIKSDVLEELESSGIPVKSATLEDEKLLVRFPDAESQLKGSKRIQLAVGQNADYTSALNLAPTTPEWLADLGASPMFLGLDLRGGVHFLMQVDMDSAMEKAFERYENDFKETLRTERVGIRGIDAKGQEIVVRFRDAAALEQGRELLTEDNDTLIFTDEVSDDSFVLRVTGKESFIKDVQEQTLQQNIAALRKRINFLGVSEPIVQRQGADRIVVQLPGVQDTAQAKMILGAQATVEFRLVHDSDANVRTPYGARRYVERNGDPINLKTDVIATGDQVTDAGSGFDQNGGPAVDISLNSAAGAHMLKTTKENLNKPMAVVFIEQIPISKEVDGEVKTSFIKKEEVINVATIRGVFSNRFQITGLDDNREAQNLALLLRAGSLAAPMYFVEERTVGPSMGKDNIDKGTMAVKIGFILVLIFMAIYYRFFGIVAGVALVLNLVLMVAILSLLQATLTLPGIAGIVLTVGMAVDANVLIFERIKEELQAGTGPQGAISAGYDKAFSTILDANITTLIAAFILLWFGTGPIKGFAITLSIGIITSMFTAIVGTRALVNLWYGSKKNIKTLSMMPLWTGKKVEDTGIFSFDFLSKKKLAMFASIAVVLIAFGSLAVQKLNFGIDFTGGTLVEVGFSKEVELDNVRKTLANEEFGDAIVQRFGENNEVLVRVPPREGVDTAGISTEILASLNTVDSNVQMRRVEFVGPQVGEELTEDGGMAIIFALLAILVYVAFRFEKRFGLGAVLALAHDVVIAIGVFSLFQIEFDLTVLAAVLAIIGYSLNDTIVVFDRIRENFRKIRKGESIDIINTSINEMLGRTMMTSVTTLLVVLALLLLGGNVIYGFSFALLIGIIVGTYSSIYVASAAALALGISKEDLMPVEKEGLDPELDRP